MAENQEGLTPQNQDPNYWRSLEELYGDPGFVEASHHEFKEGVTDPFDPEQLSGISRRKFLALLGASAALAGVGCADYRDKGEVIPYNHKPEEITPGKANFYASTCTSCANACGILIKTREGRPIKVDGNPDHPVNKGKICAKGHASILNLYDPERLQSPLKKSGNGFNSISWDDAEFEILNEITKAGGKEIAIFSSRIFSPTTLKVLEDFRNKYSSVRFYSYEQFNDNEVSTAVGGNSPLIKWNEAKIIVALESDFLGSEGNKVENVRLFGEGKDFSNTKKFNRLYAVEGNMSITGMNADYRIALRPDAQHEFVMGLLNSVSGNGDSALDETAKKYKLNSKKLKTLVKDLRANRGSVIVHAGRTLPAAVHSAVNLLNEALGAGSLYRTDVNPVNLLPLSSKQELTDLVSRMNNGSVAAVIHFDSNPVYHLPNDYGYRDALKKVSVVVTMTEQQNETSALSHYVLPINHNYEAWGDAQTRSGFYSLQQPVIYPIYNTRQKEAVLLSWLTGKSGSYTSDIFYNYVTTNWRDNIYPASGSKADFKLFWNAALHDGIVLSSASAAPVSQTNTAALLQQKKIETAGYAVIFKESYHVGDGKFANNGWLQELPHPVSKIVWDNYASISFDTAKELDVKNHDVIEISIGNRKLSIPVFLQPGSADKTITIELGYGRKNIGVVGTGVGFDAGVLLSKDYELSPWLYNNASVRKTGEVYTLVTAQEHHSFDNELTKNAAKDRKIIREGTVTQFEQNPGFLHEGEKHELNTLYGQHLSTLNSGLKWGMAIDMNKCLGCGECVVACQSENNIPVVGKEQVEKGREMHWLRIDRYYSGTPDDPSVYNQPMLCQHCDHAPCENVCPVVATTHSNDGLNQMIYNRCVGTRYCSNNCPYKVRRFNYFNFRDHFKDNYQQSSIFNLIYNPEVTVRSRGVMEKCTFCIQRIMEAREDATREKRPLKGNDVTTACQDACNANAISFGDVNEENSQVNKLRHHKLGYFVLDEVNTRPNVTYLARLRNTLSEENID